MNKPIFVVALVAASLGFGIGVAFHSWRTGPVRDLIERSPLSTLSAESTRCVTVLRLLRAGQADQGINSLEVQLDGFLIGLGPAYLSASPEVRDATRATFALRLAREYRQTSPHKPDAAIADAVAATLAIPAE